VGLTKKKDVVEGGLLEVSRVFLNPASEASPVRREGAGWPKATPIGGGCASAHKSLLPPMGGGGVQEHINDFKSSECTSFYF